MLQPANTFTTGVLHKFDPPPGTHQGDTFRLPKLKPVLFGLSEVSIWTGLNGHGKSLLLNQLALDLCKAGVKVAILSLEMTPVRTLHRMTRQATGAFHPEDWLIIQALEWIGGNVWVNTTTGTMKPEAILKEFHRLATEQGFQHFMVDSLMKCGLAEDDYNGQKALVDRLQNFAHHDKAHVHLVAHARKAQDEHGVPGKLDVKGSGAITDIADNVLSVWRNKKKESKVQENNGTVPDDLVNKPDALLDVVKHRELGGDAEGRYGLFFTGSQCSSSKRPGGQRPTITVEG